MVQCNASAGDREGGWAEWFCCFEWMGKEKENIFVLHMLLLYL